MPAIRNVCAHIQRQTNKQNGLTDHSRFYKLITYTEILVECRL